MNDPNYNHKPNNVDADDSNFLIQIQSSPPRALSKKFIGTLYQGPKEEYWNTFLGFPVVVGH